MIRRKSAAEFLVYPFVELLGILKDFKLQIVFTFLYSTLIRANKQSTSPLTDYEHFVDPLIKNNHHRSYNGESMRHKHQRSKDVLKHSFQGVELSENEDGQCHDGGALCHKIVVKMVSVMMGIMFCYRKDETFFLFDDYYNFPN